MSAVFSIFLGLFLVVACTTRKAASVLQETGGRVVRAEVTTGLMYDGMAEPAGLRMQVWYIRLPGGANPPSQAASLTLLRGAFSNLSGGSSAKESRGESQYWFVRTAALLSDQEVQQQLSAGSLTADSKAEVYQGRLTGDGDLVVGW